MRQTTLIQSENFSSFILNQNQVISLGIKTDSDVHLQYFLYIYFCPTAMCFTGKVMVQEPKILQIERSDSYIKNTYNSQLRTWNDATDRSILQPMTRRRKLVQEQKNQRSFCQSKRDYNITITVDRKGFSGRFFSCHQSP